MKNKGKVIKHRINEAVRAKEVRIVKSDNFNGVYSIHEALEIAEREGIDLIEVTASANPPICQLMEYGKFCYEQKKREKEQKSKQKQLDMKEIRLSSVIGEHDLEIKMSQAKKFLDEGREIKVTVDKINGRNKEYKKIEANKIFLQVIEDLDSVGKIKNAPDMQGKKMSAIFAPLKK